jgi:hypothetical protein
MERGVIGGFAAVFCGAGVELCLTGSIGVHVFGGALIFFALLIGASVVWGRPFPRMGPSEESTRERMPFIAPLDYQVRQLRQVLKEWEWGEFSSGTIYQFWPQVIRRNTTRKYEPMWGALDEAVFVELEKTGEIVRGSHPGTWRLTGRGEPPTPVI